MKNIVVFLLIAILTLISILFSFNSNQLYVKINKLNNSMEYYKLTEIYLNSKMKIEGHYIWQTGFMDKDQFKYLSKKIRFPKLLFWYDSLGCTACYLDQIINIKNKIGVNNTIVLYDGKIKFLKTDLHQCFFLEATKQPQSYSQFVALISSGGKVIYANFPQYGNSNLTSLFYVSVHDYLVNSKDSE